MKIREKHSVLRSVCVCVSFTLVIALQYAIYEKNAYCKPIPACPVAGLPIGAKVSHQYQQVETLCKHINIFQAIAVPTKAQETQPLV